MIERSNDTAKITVIVTVHNAEKYLEECLDSVVGQTFSEIEILCMDGGSKDESPQILKRYASKDDRIRIINDPNTSYGHKVNEGIRQASGEYIAVLESDDRYCPEMLERLYAIAVKYQPDYVNADYLNFFDKNGQRYYSVVKMYPEEDYGKLLENGEHPENMRQILRYWTGIFRRDFLIQKEIWMNESSGASFQDMSFRFLTGALAKTSYHLDMPVYQYRVDNPGSSVYDPKKAVVIADEFDFLKKELLKRNIENPHIWRHFYIWKYNDFYGNLFRFSDETRQALFERSYLELEKDKKILLSFDKNMCSEALCVFLEKSMSEVWEIVKKGHEQMKRTELWENKIFEKLQNYGIVIFGCGMRGKIALRQLKVMGVENRICCFADNAKENWHKKLDGHSILPPEEAFRLYSEAIYIIANKYQSEEIYSQLIQNAIIEKNIVKMDFVDNEKGI